MKRDVRLEEISDGKLYTSSDMVKADSRGCFGCSACCRGMGRSIILDPMDIMRLSQGLGLSFSELLESKIELNVVDGIILPNIKMGEEEDACGFLNENGRCSIHAFRPGVCRLFPLGRFYEEKGFRYFLQSHECPKEDKSKVKIRNWVGIPNLKAYEKYIWEWHSFLTTCQEESKDLDEKEQKILQMFMLRTFYEMPYESADFYEEFHRRMDMVREKLGI